MLLVPNMSSLGKCWVMKLSCVMVREIRINKSKFEFSQKAKQYKRERKIIFEGVADITVGSMVLYGKGARGCDNQRERI